MLNIDKKSKIFLTATLSLAVLSTNAFAATSLEELQKKRDSLNQELRESSTKKTFLNKELNVMNEELVRLEKQLKSLDNFIAKKEAEIYEKTVAISDIEKEIEVIKSKIKDKKKELNGTKVVIKQNLQVMYSKGEVKFLEFLIRADNISDFIYRYEVMNTALDKNKELYKQVETQLKYIEDKENELIEKQITLEDEKETIESMRKLFEIERKTHTKLSIDAKLKRKLLNQKIKEEEERLKNLVTELTSANENITTEQERLEAARKALEEANKQQLDYDFVEPPAIVGNDVVQLGIDWAIKRGLGSENPIIYSMPQRQLSMRTHGDCSTFVYRVFMDAGYGNIGLNTAEQVSNPDGHFFTNPAFLQPGDLMFFGPTGRHVLYSYLPNGKKIGTSHVGIYIGDNKMVDLSSGVGTISIKDFSPGAKYYNYVTKYAVGYMRHEKPQSNEPIEENKTEKNQEVEGETDI